MFLIILRAFRTCPIPKLPKLLLASSSTLKLNRSFYNCVKQNSPKTRTVARYLLDYLYNCTKSSSFKTIVKVKIEKLAFYNCTKLNSYRTVLKPKYRFLSKLYAFTTVSNRTVLKPRNHSNYLIFNSWMSLSEVHLALNEKSHHCVSS